MTRAAVALGIWRLSGCHAETRFRRALVDPQAEQWRHLHRLVDRNAGTDFGRRHGFHQIDGPESFRRRVPLATWPDLAPDIERIRRGEAQVLTSEPVTRLVPSSGSSAAAKTIPWTTGLQRAFAAALAPWIRDLARRFPGCLSGPGYWVISPPESPPSGDPGPVPVGFADDAAYLGGVLRHLVAPTLAVDSRALAGCNAASFALRTVQQLLRCPDLRLISVWHPSLLELLLDTLRDQRPALVETLEPHLGRRLTAWDGQDLRQLWPRLAVVSCWMDGPAHHAGQRLARRVAPVTCQAKGLLATEGVVSIPYAGRHPLAVTSQVYEFLDESGRCRWAHELARGQNYEVVLTTSGGLWRYRLADRVRVTGHLGRTPCLRFLGRSGTVSDMVGEKLDEALVAQALAQAIPAESAAVVLAADPQAQPPCYRLLAVAPLPDDATERVEQALLGIVHYRLARRLGQLGPVVAGRITAEAICPLRLAQERGLRLGSVKPPVLLPS